MMNQHNSEHALSALTELFNPYYLLQTETAATWMLLVLNILQFHDFHCDMIWLLLWLTIILLLYSLHGAKCSPTFRKI